MVVTFHNLSDIINAFGNGPLNLRPNPYNVQSVQPAGRTGIVTLKIKFSENLPNTLNVITVRAYNSAIYVDERRNFTGTLLTH